MIEWLGENWIYLAAWYGIGLACGLYWPLKYRKAMKSEDWFDVAKVLPLYALTGPLTILLMFPV